MPRRDDTSTVVSRPTCNSSADAWPASAALSASASDVNDGRGFEQIALDKSMQQIQVISVSHKSTEEGDGGKGQSSQRFLFFRYSAPEHSACAFLTA